MAGKVTETIADVASVSDGNHFSVSADYVDEGTPYYCGQDVVGNFFVEEASPNFITSAAFQRGYMSRSHLKRGDVLLSIVGTIGEASLVSSDRDATCSCKLAILRPYSVRPEYLAVYLLTRHGRSQITRNTRGAVQMGFILEDMDQIRIPRFSDRFQAAISESVDRSKRSLFESSVETESSTQLLLAGLGLESWQAPEPLSYTLNSQIAFTAGRLDAEYFAPSVSQLLVRLNRDQLNIGDVAPSRHEPFKPNVSGDFNYIEIGNLRGDGTVTADRIPMREAPSRANQFVRTGDVITSTVRSIRRLSAVVSSEQNGAVCSSGFVVLQPTHIAPEVLVTYLRLPIICQLMDLHTSASLYPAISERDLLSLPIPCIEKKTQATICSAVLSARRARDQAAELLESAKRAVEIAIEDSEAAALKYLKAVTK